MNELHDYMHFYDNYDHSKCLICYQHKKDQVATGHSTICLKCLHVISVNSGTSDGLLRIIKEDMVRGRVCWHGTITCNDDCDCGAGPDHSHHVTCEVCSRCDLCINGTIVIRHATCDAHRCWKNVYSD